MIEYMKDVDPFDNPDIRHLQLYLYLTPVFGVFPALWTLYRRQGSREQLAVSRLAVTLAFGWLLGYILLAAGAGTSESGRIPMLLANSLLTSGYFVLSISLMIRLWQRQSLRLPLISRFSERVVRKHLS